MLRALRTIAKTSTTFARWVVVWVAWDIGGVGFTMAIGGIGGMSLDENDSTQSFVLLGFGTVTVLLCVLLQEKLIGLL
ncbi:hypothetical protein [Labrys neptuniae]